MYFFSFYHLIQLSDLIFLSEKGVGERIWSTIFLLQMIQTTHGLSNELGKREFVQLSKALKTYKAKACFTVKVTRLTKPPYYNAFGLFSIPFSPVLFLSLSLTIYLFVYLSFYIPIYPILLVCLHRFNISLFLFYAKQNYMNFRCIKFWVCSSVWLNDVT